MRNRPALLLCVLLLGLTACGAPIEEEPFSAAFTIRPEPELTEVYFDTSYAEETQILYDDALNADQLRALFAQALFGADAAIAVRWVSPVRYVLRGSFTADDAQTVSDLAADLKTVPAFPGIRETTADDANLEIRFSEAGQVRFSPKTDGSGRILSAQITIPQTLESAQRKAALYQSILRACGFFFTAHTPLESVLSEDTPAAALTEADWAMLHVLYGSIEPGESEDVCLQKFDQVMLSD